MTNRELVTVYRGVKLLGAQDPSPSVAKVLERVSRMATKRGLDVILEMIDRGYAPPDEIIPSCNVPAKWGRLSIYESRARTGADSAPRDLSPA